VADTVYLQFDWEAQERFTQAVATAVETGIVDAAKRFDPPPPGRDQLAAMAMQGILAAGADAPGQAIAADAYAIADAMLAARAAPPSTPTTPEPTP